MYHKVVYFFRVTSIFFKFLFIREKISTEICRKIF